jgi:hypothetical protein
VDFKSIPYKDADVLEWYARLRLAQELHERIRDGELHEALVELRRRRVTHLVVPAGRELEDDGLEKVSECGPYQVYRLSAATGAK